MADETCPNCKIGRLEREEVDIGVGVMSGPARCLDCGWSEQLEEYDFLDGEDEPDECALHHEPLDVCGQCSTCRINESLYRDVVASREEQ